MTDARFPPIPEEEMSPEARRVASLIAGGPRGGVRGPFLPLLHHPPLAERLQALGEHLRYGTGLPDSLVELAVLVTARHWNCDYEWAAHERLARKAGLDPAIIASIGAGAVPPAMSADEGLVHAFCQGALERGAPDDADFDAANRRWGRAAVLDLLALCGYYATLAMVLNTARLALPDGTAPLPPRHGDAR